ncbi:MAG: hypothetical protein WDW38_010145 [Sanguina aurantia]
MCPILVRPSQWASGPTEEHLRHVRHIQPLVVPPNTQPAPNRPNLYQVRDIQAASPSHRPGLTLIVPHEPHGSPSQSCYSVTGPRLPSNSTLPSPISPSSWPQMSPSPPQQRSGGAVRGLDADPTASMQHTGMSSLGPCASAPPARATNPLTPQYDWPSCYSPARRQPHPVSLSEPGGGGAARPPAPGRWTSRTSRGPPPRRRPAHATWTPGGYSAFDYSDVTGPLSPLRARLMRDGKAAPLPVDIGKRGMFTREGGTGRLLPTQRDREDLNRGSATASPATTAAAVPVPAASAAVGPSPATPTTTTSAPEPLPSASINANASTTASPAPTTKPSPSTSTPPTSSPPPTRPPPTTVHPPNSPGATTTIAAAGSLFTTTTTDHSLHASAPALVPSQSFRGPSRRPMTTTETPPLHSPLKCGVSFAAPQTPQPAAKNNYSFMDRGSGQPLSTVRAATSGWSEACRPTIASTPFRGFGKRQNIPLLHQLRPSEVVLSGRE